MESAKWDFKGLDQPLHFKLELQCPTLLMGPSLQAAGKTQCISAQERGRFSYSLGDMLPALLSGLTLSFHFQSSLSA